MPTGPKRASGQQTRDKAMIALACILFGAFAVLAASVPDFLQILFFVVAIGLFCTDFNILGGGSCGDSLAQNLFGGTVLLLAGGLLVLWLRALYRAWKRLGSAG